MCIYCNVLFVVYGILVAQEHLIRLGLAIDQHVAEMFFMRAQKCLNRWPQCRSSAPQLGAQARNDLGLFPRGVGVFIPRSPPK